MNISAHLVLGLVVLGLGVTAPPAKAQSFIRTMGSLGSGNGQLHAPQGVAVDTANGSNVLAADASNNRVEVFSATGTFIRTIGSLGSGDGHLNFPSGVAVDTANASNVIVADTFNNRVEVFTSGNALPVPALGIWGLLLSALLLAGIGCHATRRSVA
jgi:hypothetical protein